MLTGRITDTVPARRLREEMDRLFERYLGVGEPSRAWNPFKPDRAPAVNVWQDDDRVHVEAELPGLTEDDIELTIKGNELTIRGERRDPEPGAGTSVHRRERFVGALSRVVRLPVDVDEDQIEATCWNGVLTVSLAKAAAARLRHIAIRTPGA